MAKKYKGRYSLVQQMEAKKERLKKYGVIRADRLEQPGPYYFDGRFEHPNQALFPRNFVYKGEKVSNTVAYILPDHVIDALTYTFGEIITNYVAYHDRLNPRFSAEIRFVGGDGVLYVWGWNSVYRLYTVMDQPYQFILEN